MIPALLPAAPARPAPPQPIAAIVRAIEPANVRRDILTLVAFGTRCTLSTQTDPHRGVGAAQDWVYGEFQRISRANGGRLQVRKLTWMQEPGTRVAEPTQMTDIVALLPGDNPGSPHRTIVVSGHCDSICGDPTDGVHDAPGADDDGSGVAVSLEMARALAPHHFAADIVFLAVTGEEQGLYGSTHYAEEQKQAGTDIEAMLDNDIVGSSHDDHGHPDASYVRVFAEGVPSAETTRQAAIRRSVGGENDSPARQLARYVAAAAGEYLPGFAVHLIWRRDRYLRGGDHIPFLERGWPAVRFTEAHEDYHHQHQYVRRAGGVQYGDLPQYVDFAYTAQVCRVNAITAACLALAPPPPKGVTLVARGLTNDTTLRWTAPAAADGVAGYEVVWRATTDATWTHALNVGRVASATIPSHSKDDWMFGVRAVGPGGYRSLAVYPMPGR